MGNEPAQIAVRGAGQPLLGAVGSQISSLTTQLALIARQHLALPVLHYLHIGDPGASIEVAVARLDEALTIIEGGPTPSISRRGHQRASRSTSTSRRFQRQRMVSQCLRRRLSR